MILKYINPRSPNNIVERDLSKIKIDKWQVRYDLGCKEGSLDISWKTHTIKKKNPTEFCVHFDTLLNKEEVIEYLKSLNI